jgi:hypothetical protein
MATPKKDALATTGDVSLAVMDPERAIDLADLSAELDGESIGMSLFSRVKIPSGGGKAFEIENPDDPDDPDIAKTIEGVVVATKRVNAYWAQGMEESGGGTPPDCASKDAVTGKGDRGLPGDTETSTHPCSGCPMNEFGSSPNGGKMCKNQWMLFVLRTDDVMPLLLTLPPTSMEHWKMYLAKAIVTKGRAKHGVVTRVGLETANSKSGVEYSRATFAVAGILPTEQVAFIGHYRESLETFIGANLEAIMAEADDDTGIAAAMGGSKHDQGPL